MNQAGVEIEGLPKGFFSKKSLGMIIALLATGIGFFAGFPDTPNVVKTFVKDFPITQWALVYVLIWQGAADYNESVALVGTAVVWMIWNRLNAMNSDETNEDVIADVLKNGLQMNDTQKEYFTNFKQQLFNFNENTDDL